MRGRGWLPVLGLGLALAAPLSAQRFTEFPLPLGAAPVGVTAGPDGNVWFTEFFGDQIGRITPSGTISTFQLVTGAAPAGIAAGPDGNLWFCESGANQIGKITTAGVLTEYPIPNAFPAGGPAYTRLVRTVLSGSRKTTAAWAAGFGASRRTGPSRRSL